jgi:UDP-GlcNAc3NAcA epimerase
MKILTILGARPQFVKAAVVSRAITRYNESGGAIREKIVHTGQHFDDNMSKVFFDEMQIPAPAHRLDIGGMGHGAMTGKMLVGIEQILMDEKPDWVLVYGDTNSTLAGALAACKLNIPVAHVEAGLRSFNRAMPEEINRILADRIARLLLCPTKTAVNNLIDEGMAPPAQSIVLAGDVMYDASRFYASLAPESPATLQGTGFDKYILCTLHRAENTDSPVRLKALINALDRIAGEIPVIIPLHPRTKKRLEEVDESLPSNVHAIDPVGYLEMLSLLQGCSAVMTDSGGLQKEAYFFRKNCVTMREETEWVELLEAGCSTLVGADEEAVFQGYRAAIDTPFMASEGIYGDGSAGDKVVSSLIKA